MVVVAEGHLAGLRERHPLVDGAAVHVRVV